IQALRFYLQRKDTEQLKSELGTSAADITQIIPDVGEILPGLKPPLTLEPEQARFRLFDSITTFLKNASQTQPLLLVLDDLHWADRPSLLLLEFVARAFETARILIIATYRDAEISRGHPLAHTLGELARQSPFQRVVLRGLNQDEVRRFVEESSSIQYTSSFIETLHSQTEGNPFFLTEVVDYLEQEGKLPAEGTGEFRIPQGIRDVINRRLDSLSAECSQTLTLAAVIGQEFGAEQLRLLARDLSDERLLEVLEEALQARIIREVPDTVDRYQFSHSLILETLTSELSVARRVRLHARIAHVLEELYGANVAEHAAELAHHFAQAEPITGTQKFVSYSLMAGEGALHSYAHEEALAHFERGLAVKEGQGVDAETAALLFGLGRAQAALLQRREALSTLSRALDYYLNTEDIPKVVDLAERLPLIPGVGRVGQYLSRALELVPLDSHDAARILSRYGLCLNYEIGDYQKAQKAFKDALTIAQREGDEALEMRTLANAAAVDAANIRWEESLEKSLRVLELARRTDDPYAEVRSQLWAGTNLYITASDFETIRVHTEASLEVAERLGDRTFLVSALWVNATLWSMKGDWQATRQFSDRGLAISPQDPRLLCIRAMTEYQTGEFMRGKVFLTRMAEAMYTTSPVQLFEYGFPIQAIPTIALITGSEDYCDLAERSALSVLSFSSATPLMAHYHTRPALALLAVQRGDREAAKREYAAIKSMPDPQRMFYFTSRDRLLGSLCVTLGQMNDALAHFENAYSYCSSAGYAVECGWIAYEYAEALLKRSRPSDQAKASSLLQVSWNTAKELGMQPLMERVTRLQAQLESRKGGAAQFPDGLTQREVEVLWLIAAGKSNREIGQALFISDRTVAQHVTSILNKTGASNRAEAATYASQHGLL
ncbi:MAG: AAA family ATPase, partial [Pyrinomonadaceae bacterium]|nr:AAA family ATPase [Pyrinomonadaceae bacterium]